MTTQHLKNIEPTRATCHKMISEALCSPAPYAMLGEWAGDNAVARALLRALLPSFLLESILDGGVKIQARTNDIVKWLEKTILETHPPDVLVKHVTADERLRKQVLRWMEEDNLLAQEQSGKSTLVSTEPTTSIEMTEPTNSMEMTEPTYSMEVTEPMKVPDETNEPVENDDYAAHHAEDSPDDRDDQEYQDDQDDRGSPADVEESDAFSDRQTTPTAPVSCDGCKKKRLKCTLNDQRKNRACQNCHQRKIRCQINGVGVRASGGKLSELKLIDARLAAFEKRLIASMETRIEQAVENRMQEIETRRRIIELEQRYLTDRSPRAALNMKPARWSKSSSDFNEESLVNTEERD